VVACHYNNAVIASGCDNDDAGTEKIDDDDDLDDGHDGVDV